MARTLEALLANEKPEVVAAAQAKANDLLLALQLAGLESAEQNLRLSPLKRRGEGAGDSVPAAFDQHNATRDDRREHNH